MTEYLTTTQAARRIGVSPARVRQYVTDKLLVPADVPFVRDHVFLASDVEKFSRPCGKRGPNPAKKKSRK